eukprot:1223473-Pyramimonas_sp.AAC.1
MLSLASAINYQERSFDITKNLIVHYQQRSNYVVHLNAERASPMPHPPQFEQMRDGMMGRRDE